MNDDPVVQYTGILLALKLVLLFYREGLDLDCDVVMLRRVQRGYVSMLGIPL